MSIIGFILTGFSFLYTGFALSIAIADYFGYDSKNFNHWNINWIFSFFLITIMFFILFLFVYFVEIKGLRIPNLPSSLK